MPAVRLWCALVAGIWLAGHSIHGTPPEPVTVGRLVVLAGGGTAPVALVNEALTSRDPAVRAVAARLVASFGASALQPRIEEALAKEIDPGAGGELVRALLLLGGAAALGVADPHAKRLGPLATRPILERNVIWPRLDGGLPSPELPVTDRLLPQWLPGILSSAAREAGCPLESKPVFGYARVTLLQDGRTKSLQTETGELPASCTPVLAGLARLTIADFDRLLPPDLFQVLVLPFTKEYAECAPTADHVEHLRGGAPGWSPPRKIVEVEPTYPPDIPQQYRAGLVVLDTTVNDAGCVEAARVIRSPAVSVSLAALRAISGWRFRPSRMQGRPVPFRMLFTLDVPPRR